MQTLSPYDQSNARNLAREWQTLQEHHEQHEKNALLIKLVCVVLFTLTIGLDGPQSWLIVSVVLLWMQEAIIKTYQSRIADRLQRVEAALALPESSQPAMQLHTEWAAKRPGAAGLIAGYALSACKPTVAFPHVPLLVFALWWM